MPLFNNDIHESYQPIRGQKTILRHCGPIGVAPIFENFPRKDAATICDMSRKITTSLSTNNRPHVDTKSLIRTMSIAVIFIFRKFTQKNAIALCEDMSLKITTSLSTNHRPLDDTT